MKKKTTAKRYAKTLQELVSLPENCQLLVAEGHRVYEVTIGLDSRTLYVIAPDRDSLPEALMEQRIPAPRWVDMTIDGSSLLCGRITPLSVSTVQETLVRQRCDAELEAQASAGATEN